MKYRELFTLNPIKTVIKIQEADQKTKARAMVSRFVITRSLGEQIERVALPQLDPNRNPEGKGLFVVGNYGTGKSHLMSFLSLLAQSEEYLGHVQDPGWRDRLKCFAGQYCVRRHEIAGSLMSLYEIVTQQLSTLAKDCSFDFSFEPAERVANIKTELQRFMEAFDEHQPGKGVLLVTDELLEHLKGRNDAQLEHDLSVLRALGEFCDGSRFVFMAGLQQLLFAEPRFHHMADSVDRVRQRYYDLRIDREGVAQLVEDYLLHKSEDQRRQIRTLLEPLCAMYEGMTTQLDEFVSLFPVHPRFLDEFQRIHMVERREILTVLSTEAQALLEREVEPQHLSLITADKYWPHLENDAGLNANRDLAKLKGNVATIRSRVQAEMTDPAEAADTLRLIYGLAINRLTTPTLNSPVGLTPQDLKNNLLWRTSVALDDPEFLTGAAKRLLDRARDATNGQFLSVSAITEQYYIDPEKTVDYEQQVETYSKTINGDIVQGYLNRLFTAALEIDNEQLIIERRLWGYSLPWADKNVDRPGWLFFGFPNQRSTAQPPKDFYLFIIPSVRLTGVEESWSDAEDESYWSLDEFPEDFEKALKLYASANQLAAGATGDDRSAFNRIAKRHQEVLLSPLASDSGHWITVRWNGQQKHLVEWVADLAPSQRQALFKTRLDAISAVMFGAHFDSKYPGYPEFSVHITEATRGQAAQAAIEIICGVGMTTGNGLAVLAALGLYQDDTPTPERSPWLQEIKCRLAALEEGQVLNNSDLFEQREGRVWLKGGSLEAEWVQVVLTAGVVAGDLVIVGPKGSVFDAANPTELYNTVKGWEQIIRVRHPEQPPLERWERLFRMLGLNLGLLANPNTYGEAITKFQICLTERINRLVEDAHKLQLGLPFATEESVAALEMQVRTLKAAQERLEPLQALNTKARLQNLRLTDPELDELEQWLKVADSVHLLLGWVEEELRALDALGRYQAILEASPDFQTELAAAKTTVQDLCGEAGSLKKADLVPAMEAVQGALKTALVTYQMLKKKHCLDRGGDQRKRNLIQGKGMARLNKLVGVRVITLQSLEDLRSRVGTLPVYKGCTDEELLRSPTSLCPHTQFDPRSVTCDLPANEVLEQCVEGLERLEQDWTEQLLKELCDPALQASLEALKKGERKLVESFVQARALPEVVDDAFIKALNTALSGLHRRVVKADELAQALWGDHQPLKSDELQERFVRWLQQQIGSEAPETVRFVGEE